MEYIRSERSIRFGKNISIIRTRVTEIFFDFVFRKETTYVLLATITGNFSKDNSTDITNRLWLNVSQKPTRAPQGLKRRMKINESRGGRSFPAGTTGTVFVRFIWPINRITTKHRRRSQFR